MVKLLKETLKSQIRWQLFSNIKAAEVSDNKIIAKIINEVRNLTNFSALIIIKLKRAWRE